MIVLAIGLSPGHRRRSIPFELRDRQQFGPAETLVPPLHPMTQVAAHALQVPAEAGATASPPLRPAVRIPRPEEWLADATSSFLTGVKREKRAQRAAALTSSEPAPVPAETPPAQERLRRQSELAEFAAKVAEANRLLVVLGSPVPGMRSKLAAFINGSIETQLHLSGAVERGAAVPENLSDILGDQLYRARLLGLDGLGLAFDELRPISKNGVLSPTDSQTVRWWLDAASRHPLNVHLSERVQKLHIYTAPVCLSGFGCMPRAVQSASRRQQPRAVAHSSQAELPFEQGLRDELRLKPKRSEARPPAARIDGGPEQPLSGLRASPAVAPLVSEQEHIRKWRKALSDVSGAQTWATLETQYTANYLPLLHARMANQADERSEEVLRVWARHFQSSYEGAYAKLCRYSQRPQMIFDLPKIAFNLGRQAEAAQVRLVLVDGMRFDLGQRVHDKLRLQLTGLGRCVARGVTWSSLPCSTSAQLELLARGADGLRSPLGKAQIPGLVASGAGARKLRPLRTGPHQLYKLDALQPLLARGVSWGPEELEQAAAEVAVSVGRFLKQQPQNTLMLLFGDHGFDLLDGSSEEATPENVLVPYDAWLLAD